VNDPKKREMMSDLYRMAEYYESPPFRPGDIEWNSQWFIEAQEKHLKPFILKYGSQLATDLAIAVVDDASRRAAELNKMESVL
jgi:hypothetical protein